MSTCAIGWTGFIVVRRRNGISWLRICQGFFLLEWLFNERKSGCWCLSIILVSRFKQICGRAGKKTRLVLLQEGIGTSHCHFLNSIGISMIEKRRDEETEQHSSFQALPKNDEIQRLGFNRFDDRRDGRMCFSQKNFVVYLGISLWSERRKAEFSPEVVDHLDGLDRLVRERSSFERHTRTRRVSSDLDARLTRDPEVRSFPKHFSSHRSRAIVLRDVRIVGLEDCLRSALDCRWWSMDREGFERWKQSANPSNEWCPQRDHGWLHEGCSRSLPGSDRLFSTCCDDQQENPEERVWRRCRRCTFRSYCQDRKSLIYHQRC